MNPRSSLPFITRGSVVKLSYRLSIDGDTIISVDKDHPVEFVQGNGEIISGLENSLYGMRKGEIKQVRIEPILAYGKHNPTLLVKITKSELPSVIPLFPGVILEVKDRDGNLAEGRIDKVESDIISIDFNHPLSGKILDFDIKIEDVIPPEQTERR